MTNIIYRKLPLLFFIGSFLFLSCSYADKKRAAPLPVQAIELLGVRYEVALHGSMYGYHQDGGIIVAKKINNSQLLWTQKVYEIEYNEEIESDKQDIFIKSLVLNAQKTHLLITNERDKKYKLMLIPEASKLN